MKVWEFLPENYFFFKNAKLKETYLYQHQVSIFIVLTTDGH